MASSVPSPDRIPTESGDRDARIEQLLLAGLDLYFAGRFEQAINVWTRVSFLERGHGRARAYIERARGAIAERQREGDELLHQGVDAFQRGETDRARELLTAAVERAGQDDLAATVLARVQRLGPSGQETERRPPASPVDEARGAALADGPVEAPARPQRRVSLPLVIVGAALAGAVCAGVAIEVWFAPGGGTTQAIPGRAESVPVPRAADLTLSRARALASGGHLPDALRALEGVGPLDPGWAEAERLRAAWQAQLLELAGLGAPVVGRP